MVEDNSTAQLAEEARTTEDPVRQGQLAETGSPIILRALAENPHLSDEVKLRLDAMVKALTKSIDRALLG